MKKTGKWQNRSFVILSLFLVFVLGMGGCGQQPSEEAGKTEEIEGSQESSGIPALPSIAGTEGQASLRGSYRLEELNFPDPDFCLLGIHGENLKVISFQFHLTTDGIVYRSLITMDTQSNTKQGHYIQKLEPPYESWTLTAIPFLYSDGESEYKLGNPYLHQESIAFRDLSREDGIECWASCDEDGNVIEVLGEFPEPIQSDYNNYILTVGRAGNLYAHNEYGDRMFCLNREMEVEREVSTFNLMTMDGVITDASEEKVYWYGHADSEVGIYDFSGELIAEVDISICGSSPQIDMSGNGEIYMASSSKMWQLQGEERKFLCDFSLYDYPWEELYSMKIQEDGSILLFGRLDGDYCLVRALEGTKTGQENRQEIIIAFLDKHVGMQKSISRFNRQNDQYHITAILKEDDENWIDYDKRIQLEISAGKGPDIISDDLVVDMSGYLKNGYFISLEGLIDDESQYLAAAFEGGRVNGELYGMPYDFAMQFAAYSEDFAKGRTSWTLPELMKAVENSDAEILQYDYDGLDIVMWYGLYDNDNTAYIDWEKGESHLTEAPFLELLNFARRYEDKNAGKSSSNRETEGELLLSGRAFATAPYIYMCDFDELHALDVCFAGKPALLGYPRTEGNGIYAASRYLYVSSTSDCKEGAMAFLRFLLSEEEQSRYMICKVGDNDFGYIPYFPVNLNAFEKLVSYRFNWESDVVEYTTRGLVGHDLSGLTEKQLEEIDFLMENIRPDNWYAREIRSIISEELAPYFAGVKTAEQAAEVLNRRVQIYLDERK